METIWRIVKGVASRKWKTAIFSITSACNCRCSMCNIPNLPQISIAPEKGGKILRQCSKNGVLFLSFTGGEPLLHPSFPSLARAAKGMGFVIHVASNGTLPNGVRILKGSVDVMGFSVDSMDPQEHDLNRKHKGAFEKVRRSIQNCRKLGIKAYANTPPNVYIADKIEEYVEFMNGEWGIPVGFCYPETGNRGYFSTDENIVSVLSHEKIAEFFRSALKLKKGGYEILNTDVYLREAVEYAKGNFSRVSRCWAGEGVYWIDWHGDVHPCFSKEETLNTCEKWEKYSAEKCNDCFTQCFREPSSVISNIPSLINELKILRALS